MLGAASAAGLGGLAFPVFANTPQVIKFGQSASLTGGQAEYGKNVRDGILAAFAAASRADNGNGPRFELLTMDDGGVKDRCAKNVVTLIDSGVSAVVGLTSGAGAEACMQVVQESQVPLIGTASGNMGIRQAKTQPVFNVRAGYDLEYRRMVNYAKDFGMSRLGVVYLKDTSKANMDALTQSLAQLSVAPKESIGVDRNDKSFDTVADALLAAKLDCVLFATNSAPAAAIIDRMMASRYAGLFYASSFGGQSLLDTLIERKQSCIMSAVVPRPSASRVSVVSRCAQDLAAIGAESKMGITTLEGYIAGRTAVEAVRSAMGRGGLGKGRFKESLAGLRADLGGYKIDFAGTMQGSQYVDLIAIDRFGRLVG
jgi:ABC-type branched-subunit amino acid transport system substrate-binding protein